MTDPPLCASAPGGCRFGAPGEVRGEFLLVVLEPGPTHEPQALFACSGVRPFVSLCAHGISSFAHQPCQATTTSTGVTVILKRLL